MTEPIVHEPMTAKRLADIGTALEVTERPSVWHELYDEVQRLRAKRVEQRERLVVTRNERDWAITERNCARDELVAATARAEQAEAEVERLRNANRMLAKDVLRALTRATAAETALAELRERLGEAGDEPDVSGWSAAEAAEFDGLYSPEAAMRYRAQLDRVWRVVQDLRDEAVAAGLDPYRDPMAQRLSAALVGADATSRTALECAADEQGVPGDRL